MRDNQANPTLNFTGKKTTNQVSTKCQLTLWLLQVVIYNDVTRVYHSMDSHINCTWMFVRLL